jgi:hypothetical protein
VIMPPDRIGAMRLMACPMPAQSAIGVGCRIFIFVKKAGNTYAGGACFRAFGAGGRLFSGPPSLQPRFAGLPLPPGGGGCRGPSRICLPSAP